MEPVVLKRPEHIVSRKEISSAAIKTLYRLKDAGYTAYIAGGGVRDLLLKRHPKDFDVVTNATPNEVRKIFRNCRIIGRRFRLAHVLYHGEVIETSTFRAPGPEENAEVNNNTFRTDDSGFVSRDNIFGTPEQDALRRDFTINALFYNIADFSIIDYAGGLKDLDQKIIRVIGDPDTRFAEDPVRMIRAARFAGTLDFEIEQKAFESICRNRDLLEQASASRMYEEVQKLFFCGHAKNVFCWLEKADLLHPIFHDFSHWLDEDEARRKWVMQTLEQMDRWRKANLKIHPQLLFALVFGEYHEFLAKQLIADGIPEYEAAQAAVYNHLTGMCEQVRVPKQIIHKVAEIMSNQQRFTQTKGRRPARFMQNHGFLDAFLYFKYASKALDRHHAELVDWADRRKQRMESKQSPNKG